MTEIPTKGWAYAMPVYSTFRRDSGAQVIAATPEECVEAMWAAKCDVDRHPWEPMWSTIKRLHEVDETPIHDGHQEDIRVVPA